MAARAYDQQVTETRDDAHWTAVLARDETHDGRFVYAVASTGVYCRPSCPSKRPTRRQVMFYDNSTAAESAGYRPCRRCDPATPGPSAATRRLLQARDHLDRHPDTSVTLEQLGRLVGLSPHHLQRSFKRFTGLSPRAYANARKLERLKARLRAGDTVTRATFEAGYSSGSRAYEHSDQLGMTPATYRRGGRGAHIRYTIVPTTVGQLLVASTDRGLCSVMLGDNARTLDAELRREFPHATIERADEALATWAAELAKLASGNAKLPTLPVDVPATAFQWRVWEILRRIPRGARRSYGDIAAELGQVTAARAVARACATNPLALMIPCHRVVREDGGLGGYRWGITRKQELLEREQQSD